MDFTVVTEADDELVGPAPQRSLRASLLNATALGGYAGRVFDMAGREAVGDVLFAGSKIGGAALNASPSSIIDAAFSLGGRLGGENVQKIANEAAFLKSVGDAILNPGFEAIGAVLGGGLRRLGVDPAIADGASLAGKALQLAILGGGPLAAVGLVIGFAEYMDARVGQPNVIRLSTTLEGQEAAADYQISAQEYHHFLDAQGREAHSFTGGLFEMDGKFYLGGSFGYDPLNALTGGGEGGLAGAVLGLPGGFIQRRGDGAMMESLEIDKELYDQLLALNGGREQLQAAAGDPIFALVAPRMGLVEEVRYTADGLLSDLMPGVTLLTDPLGGRGGATALFSNPLMAGQHHFRDPEQAAMFGAFGLMAAMMVAGDPEQAKAFGGFDAQRLLDHLAANGEALAGSPMFDVYGYLAANPDVAQAVGSNIMDAVRHYLDIGVHEGRSTQATEEAKTVAMARVTGLALYDEAVYLALNPDVAEAVARGEFPDGRAHYEAAGFDEGRMAFFDADAYLAANPDVAEAIAANGGTALEHFIAFGRTEGRPLFPPQPEVPAGYDEAAYLAQNPDVAEAVAVGELASGLDHFRLFGQAEGRAYA